MEQVCDACGVDHTLLDAAGVGILSERNQTLPWFQLLMELGAMEMGGNMVGG